MEIVSIRFVPVAIAVDFHQWMRNNSNSSGLSDNDQLVEWFVKFAPRQHSESYEKLCQLADYLQQRQENYPYQVTNPPCSQERFFQILINNLFQQTSTDSNNELLPTPLNSRINIEPRSSFYRRQDAVLFIFLSRLLRASSAANPFQSAAEESFNMSQLSSSRPAVFITKNQKTLDELGVKEEDIPEAYICSLTCHTMDEPGVLLNNGVSIDKRAWDRCPRNPYTNNPKNPRDFVPNETLKKEIDIFVQSKKEAKEKARKNKMLTEVREHKEERDEKDINPTSNPNHPLRLTEQNEAHTAEQTSEGHEVRQRESWMANSLGNAPLVPSMSTSDLEEHQQRTSQQQVALRAHSLMSVGNDSREGPSIPLPQPQEQNRQENDESSGNDTYASIYIISV